MNDKWVTFCALFSNVLNIIEMCQKENNCVWIWDEYLIPHEGI